MNPVWKILETSVNKIYPVDKFSQLLQSRSPYLKFFTKWHSLSAGIYYIHYIQHVLHA